MNDTLKVLKLDGNKCGSFGGMAIAGALQVNITLEELNMNNTEQVCLTVFRYHFTVIFIFGDFPKVSSGNYISSL